MYERRVKMLLALMGLVFLGILTRLFQLQVWSGAQYRQEITRQTWRDDVLPASRGHILDRQGAILAVDEPCFDLCVDYRLLFSWFQTAPDDAARRAFRKKVAWWEGQQRKALLAAAGPREDRRSPEQWRDLGAEMLHQHVANTWRVASDLAGSDAALEETCRAIVARVERLRDASRHKNPREQFMAHPVVQELDEAQAVAVKAQLDDLAGVTVQPSFKRRYPYGQLACHVIGYTGQVSAADQEHKNSSDDNGDPYLDGEVIGKSGVERMCEDLLRGRRGNRRMNRITGALVSQIPTENGQDVHLTLDIALQEELAKLFPAGASGCIVVLSVPRGEVLAMVSLPGFDLNTFRADYAKLVKDDLYLPLRNRAVSQLYAPGSTAKPIVALAGLATGAIDLNTTFVCTGYLDPAEPNAYRCWTVKRGLPGHGPMNVVEGLKHSCNVFFYHVGQAVGGPRLAAWFAQFGFTESPHVGLPEERAGLVAPGAGLADSRQMGIGQGPIAVTPLHVANAMATIARDGVFCDPILVMEGAPSNLPREQRRLPLDPAYLAAVKLGMYKVVNDSDGTAYKPFHEGEFEPLGIDVCGKTGTATVAPETTASGRRREGDMAWFAGFAPYKNPQIAFAVVVEYVQQGGGAVNAGPIARETIRACMKRGYIHAEGP
ncbi:MAG: penicillin-binding transpeptidase domain-containing protein [Phycisphaerae bacterium]|jgi:penicillin-binding protein 2